MCAWMLKATVAGKSIKAHQEVIGNVDSVIVTQHVPLSPSQKTD